MKKDTNHQIKLGILVMSALAIFIFSIYFLGRKQSLFRSVLKVYTTFSDVKGLLVGNNVRFSGINIGTVSQISISNDSTILVEFSITENASEFIRKDSKVTIENEGIMGSKLLVIGKGEGNSERIENKDTLQSVGSVNIENMISETEKIITHGQIMAVNLAEISEKLNSGTGDLSKLLNQSVITNKMDSLGQVSIKAMDKINSITSKIDNGKGDLGVLINDTQLSERMAVILKKLDSVSARADELTYQLTKAASKINTGDGLIHRLIYDSLLADNIDTTITKINTGIDDVIQVAGVVEESWVLNLFKKKKKNNKGKP